MSKAQPYPVSSVSNLSGASQFIYDEAGQLVKEIADSPFYKYAYDSKGNILTAKEYAVAVNEYGEKVYTLKTDGNNTFVYGNTWQDKLTTFNGQSITYDAIGNPLSYKGNTLTWTMGRQLATYGTNTYTYNEDGIRTSKTVDGVTTQYYFNGTDIIQQSDGTNTLYFYYDNASEVVGFNYNNNDYFYVKNMMDDIVAIVDNTGTVVAEYTYNPWGEVTSVTGSNVTLGELNPFRYRSYYYDSDIEMYYLQSRYYDPEICRFINCDDVNYIGLTESEISYNPFAYCENDPVNKVDASGCASNSASGYSYGYNYSAYYRALNKKSHYRIFCSIDKTSVFGDYDNGVIKVWNAQSNIGNIFKGKTRTFAYVLFIMARRINKKSLSQRTVDGVAYELIAHYVWYKKNIVKKRTEVTDCGGNENGQIGYDYNAYIFEKDKNKLNSVEELVKQGKLNSALAKLSSTLVKLGWQKVSSK